MTEQNIEHVCDESCTAEAERILNTPLSTRELNETLAALYQSVQVLTTALDVALSRVERLEAAASNKGTSDVRYGQYL